MALNQGFTYREKLGGEAVGLTVLEYLSRQYRHSSATEWRCRIDDGRVCVDGTPVDISKLLRPGQTLTWHRPPWREPDAPTCYALLYEDRHLLGVGKPRGLPSLPGGGFLEKTLLYQVRRRYPEASPLHRLGRGTSGIMLFARTGLARTELTEAWQKTDVIRIYRALVQGTPEESAFTVDEPIGPVPHPLLGKVHALTQSGKPARSHVRVLETREDTSLVQVQIVTGRPHQIRIHLAAAGLPLVGDRLYPPGGVPHEDTNVLPGDLGYWLHASELRFRHPDSGATVALECTPPPILLVSRHE